MCLDGNRNKDEVEGEKKSSKIFREVGVVSFPFYCGDQEMIFRRINGQVFITKATKQGVGASKTSAEESSFPFYCGDQEMIFRRVDGQIFITKVSET